MGSNYQLMIYYNDNDPKSAAWLRTLIAKGFLPDGTVDERSIHEIKPDELRNYLQCHFFAGIGGWVLALRLAGWPDDQPVWTGSCPCQPFSVAGRGKGTADARHLWPVFRDLIRECRPPVVFGEQVAGKAGREWLTRVFADLEALAYRRAGADLCAAGVGAPHIRQRLWWVADAGCKRDERRGIFGELAGASGDAQSEARQWQRSGDAVGDSGTTGRVDNPASPRRDGSLCDAEREARDEARLRLSGEASGLGGLGNATSNDERRHSLPGEHGQGFTFGGSGRPWDSFDLIPCTDGKTRRIEPGSSPLAHGVSGRVGLLRGYGNAIVPEIAAEFIRAYREAAAESETMRADNPTTP